MNKNLLSLGALAAAGTLFLGANILANKGLRGVRIDLTENRLYTLSAGSRNIAAAIDEPVTLRLYYAVEQSNHMPDASSIKAYYSRVSEMLHEYALASKGKIRVETIDPKPFSDEEDAALEAGLAAIPTGRGGERLYFGLVGVNTVGKTEIIPLFTPQKEEFLEYDLTRLIYQLSDPPRRVVGLMATSLPMEGLEQNPLMGRGMPPWQIVTQMRNFFDVRKITAETTSIPEDVGVLMLVHPKNVSEAMLYEIDQFVLRGGRLMVFVDPWCEADLPPGINPTQAMGLPRNSNLQRLFDAWGVELVDGVFAGDRTYAIRLQSGPQNRSENLPHVNYLALKGPALSKTDALTGTMETINVGAAGVLVKKPGAEVTFEPLLQTSADSMLIETSRIQMGPDARSLLAEFTPGNQPLTIAARVSGQFKSAFPGGDPAAVEGDTRPHLAEAAGTANIIIVADADMLHDRFWVQQLTMGNIVLGVQPFANNGDFVITALDNLTGSNDLMSVRARGKFHRPFDRVEEMRKEAEQKFLAKEQELKSRLQQAEQRLTELVSRQAPQQGGMIMLTPEQQAEIDQTRRDVLALKKQLREVNHQLRADIERLGSRISLVNVAAMPVVVGLAAVGLSALRVARRRADRRAAART
jgi:ABC-type uncharacterized transport system involved in gliding motility auxiliary subunit